MKTRSDLGDSILVAKQSAEDIIPAELAAFDRLVAKVNGNLGGLCVCGVSNAPRLSEVSIPINFIKGPSSISAVQFDLILPIGVVFKSVTLGSAAVLANKQASSGPITNGVRIIVFGLNQTVLGDGLLVTILVSISNASPTNFQTVSLSGVVASRPEGVSEVCCGVSGGLVIS